MSPAALNEWIDDALAKCPPTLLTEDDESIEYTLLEDVCIDMVSCFYPPTLALVRDAGFINEEIYRQLLQIRQDWEVLDKQSSGNAATIRQDPRWLTWLHLCDHTRQLKAAYAAQPNT